jgi:hypothetical protein
MKKPTMPLPPEMKHILSTLGIPDGDVLTVERRMKERAALQVQDYLEVVCRKIAPFEGVEVSADVRETMEMLRAPKRPHNS